MPGIFCPEELKPPLPRGTGVVSLQPPPTSWTTRVCVSSSSSAWLSPPLSPDFRPLMYGHSPVEAITVSYPERVLPKFPPFSPCWIVSLWVSLRSGMPSEEGVHLSRGPPTSISMSSCQDQRSRLPSGTCLRPLAPVGPGTCSRNASSFFSLINLPYLYVNMLLSDHKQIKISIFLSQYCLTFSIP